MERNVLCQFLYYGPGNQVVRCMYIINVEPRPLSPFPRQHVSLLCWMGVGLSTLKYSAIQSKRILKNEAYPFTVPYLRLTSNIVYEKMDLKPAFLQTRCTAPTALSLYFELEFIFLSICTF